MVWWVKHDDDGGQVVGKVTRYHCDVISRLFMSKKKKEAVVCNKSTRYSAAMVRFWSEALVMRSSFGFRVGPRSGSMV